MTYPVEVAAYEDEKDPESKMMQIYHIDLLLVRKDTAGFET